MHTPLHILRSAALAAAVLVASPVMAGTADVRFENADRFADAGRGHAADATQQALAAIFQDLAGRRLPDGQVLSVVVTDVDLAGDIPFGAGRLHDVRVMGRPVDWPRISLRYTLQEGERVLGQGSAEISDMAYLQRGSPLSPHGALPYERRMLADWFARSFTPATAR
jgi:hypothetical protein